MRPFAVSDRRRSRFRKFVVATALGALSLCMTRKALVILSLAAVLIVARADAIQSAPPACEAAARMAGPDWARSPADVGRIYLNHPSGAALSIECDDARAVVAYIQLGNMGTDISHAHSDVATVVSNFLDDDVPARAIRSCIRAVKMTTDTDIWRKVAGTGEQAECGKDADSHYFRITLRPR